MLSQINRTHCEFSINYKPPVNRITLIVNGKSQKAKIQLSLLEMGKCFPDGSQLQTESSSHMTLGILIKISPCSAARNSCKDSQKRVISGLFPGVLESQSLLVSRRSLV